MVHNKEKSSLAIQEEKILVFWKENNIFFKSLNNRKDGSPFFFYDGPPFATGLPHYGHMLAGTIKDTIGRYKTMTGYYVPRRFGWDCHGVPVEYEVEKVLNIQGSILDFGIEAFNERCREVVLRYEKEWESRVERMGRWVDFRKTWKTMDISFMESVWWVFSELYRRGFVYEDVKVVPFSPKLNTPLSNFEAGQNYKEVDDPSVIVKVVLNDESPRLLVWTTTPWTLVSNMAIAVGEGITYLTVRSKETGECFIIGENSVLRWFSEGSFIIENKCLGKDLSGKSYRPIFDYFESKQSEGAFRIVCADFVSEEDGTGLVHMAPGFGESDFYACRELGIPLVCPVGSYGMFTEAIPEYVGLFVKDADKSIISRLKNSGMLFFRGSIRHRYPFCWRTDTPLIYKAVNSWFISVESLKSDLIRANESISWVPDHIRSGRFGKWLAGARDWAISRNRYWGTPIPVWKNEQGESYVIGSIKELEDLTGREITDLHRHRIDDLTFVKDGSVYKRIGPIFDCWFESGAMPYGQSHYPFDQEAFAEQGFPADFIAEGLDQTRGWFYTLNVLSVALFNQPAFKNAVVNGIVLAEDGNKMSKRLNNYPLIDDIIDTYGADALRLYMLGSPAVSGEDLKFSVSGVESVLRQVIIPLRNALSFFKMYADVCGVTGFEYSDVQYTVIDRWILSRLNSLIKAVGNAMEAYFLSDAVEPLIKFIDDLTNWYIRRSRRRFWSDIDSADRRAAFATLAQVLITFGKIVAPFIPFTAEDLYLKLRTSASEESVHLTDFPSSESLQEDLGLENVMRNVRSVVGMGHSLRKEHRIKVRQPLPRFYIVGRKEELAELSDFVDLISDELNVKEMIFLEDSPDFIKTTVKPNFRILGKKVGSLIQEIGLILENLDEQAKLELYQGRAIEIVCRETVIAIFSEDVQVIREACSGYIADSDGAFTVILDIRLTPELELEGDFREMVSKLNNLRKLKGFGVTDRIEVLIQNVPRIREVFEKYETDIRNEILAVNIGFSDDFHEEELDINGSLVSVKLTVVH
ncbi:MAG: isoleucine--tRNA ligase [Victivallaceae bacterium]